MSPHNVLSPRQKALQINLDETIYGSFAEIGAGQEVARHFFQAGGAAGTIARTMSAYDMIMSDAMYGETGRYVSEERLISMLKTECSTLMQRLDLERGESSRFFTYANTVTAKGYRGAGNYHGWTGIKFQQNPGEEPSQVVIHIKLLDNQNLFQQEAIGTFGVNLIHSCYYANDSMEHFVRSLMDNLTNERILIDAIKVTGPAFRHMDDRLLSLELVNNCFTDVIMFNDKGKVVQHSEELYKKNIVALRGSFRPPTLLNMEMLQKGAEQFRNNLPEDEGENIMTLAEISMNRLIERGSIDSADFLARIDMLTSINQPVLISHFQHFHTLSHYLSDVCRRRVAFAARVHNLQDIFDEENYKNLDGGFLEAFGTMFGKNTQIYVYPEKADDEDMLLASDSVTLSAHVKPLMEYFKNHNFIQDIKNFNPNVANIWSRKVVEKIEAGDSTWEEMVPASVAEAVKKSNLFRSN
ncbi:nicotinate-nucleotide adenylyltransferase [Prosthecochloris marina]|uniref:Nicotinate-nucleotide adenylyltransferase n=1 Tax=Prosthecochloris marina TaxID=2017681 RepID=A0A317T554_9CHLB|nr:nicotinate-nucleotide adenylyltransferase [Prosthecochloris marina]PWW81783.1 nicotinate-nucleotide adenylyltransferase [Prosthecochloris marina]